VRARWGIWLADQDWERTLSKGIYTYARLLTRELAGRMATRGTVVVNSVCRDDMVPSAAPVDVVQLAAGAAHGPLRMLADQVGAPAVAAWRKLDLLHFPKGFVPAWSGSRTRLTATLHDAIPLHYAAHHPGYFPAAKIAYLRRAMVTTLRRSHAIATDSSHSADALLRLAASAGVRPPRLEVMGLTPDPALTDPPWDGPRSDGVLLHLGSRLPHKRTHDLLRAFRTLNGMRGGRYTLRVVGLRELPPEWGFSPDPDVQLLGTLAVPRLREELGRAAALLLPSDVEGFGLPALEAWFLGTPVCHSGRASLGEVLAGLPGVFDVDRAASLAAALDDVLALGAPERAAIATSLRARYGLETFGRRAAELMGAWLA
jgi:glycosyltransferase involved in cell wall biosynthesis